jgi:hypothetical protein
MFRQLIVKYAKVLSTECFADCCDYRRLSVAGYSQTVSASQKKCWSVLHAFQKALEIVLFPLGRLIKPAF